MSTNQKEWGIRLCSIPQVPIFNALDDDDDERTIYYGPTIFCYQEYSILTI